MNAQHQEHPSHSRPSSERPPRRARPHPDSMVSEHVMHEEHQASTPPQHHEFTPEQPAEGSASAAFDFFYSLVFSFVHAALTVLFSPVLRKDRRRRPASTKSKARRSSSWRTFMENDPELAIPNDATDTSSNTRGSSSGSYHQPILKTQSSRLSSDNKKSVRFPAPERSRPPLGRIGVGSSSSSVSSSSSNSSSSSRSGARRKERSSSRTGVTSYSGSSCTTPSRGNGRRTSSSFGTMTSPRMSHSSYFLE